MTGGNSKLRSNTDNKAMNSNAGHYSPGNGDTTILLSLGIMTIIKHYIWRLLFQRAKNGNTLSDRIWITWETFEHDFFVGRKFSPNKRLQKIENEEMRGGDAWWLSEGWSVMVPGLRLRYLWCEKLGMMEEEGLTGIRTWREPAR